MATRKKSSKVAPKKKAIKKTAKKKVTAAAQDTKEDDLAWATKDSMWTVFWDMHSGGSQKLSWAKIYIEAHQPEAISVFYARFDRSPSKVTCTCCGEDYSIDSTRGTFAFVSGYHRGCAYDNEAKKYVERGVYKSVGEYLKSKDVLVIRKHEIGRRDRGRTVPTQGYVWQD